MPTSEARPKARMTGAVHCRHLGSVSNARSQSGRSAAAFEEQDRQSTEDVPLASDGKTHARAAGEDMRRRLNRPCGGGDGHHRQPDRASGSGPIVVGS